MVNKQERKILREIKKDCLALQLEGKLTEFGWGQLYLVYLLNGSCARKLPE